MSRTLRLVVTAALACSSLALAAEKKIPESEVPQAGLDAVRARYPGAKLSGFEKEVEKGKTVYEIQLLAKEGKVDVDVSPAGEILTEETQVPVEAVPAEVLAGVKATRYAGWKLSGAERIIQHQDAANPSYELKLGHGKQRVELTFDRAGKLLGTEKAGVEAGAPAATTRPGK